MIATFKVLRAHIGERDYQPGDTRKANVTEVAHLVASGTLEEVKVVAPPEVKARKPRGKA